jgi:hypothetical protein
MNDKIIKIQNEMEEKVEALSSLVEVLFPPGILLCM